MPLRPGHIKPSVQALALKVQVLIPHICAWYADTPDTENKRQITNRVVDRYNDLVFKFSRDTGVKYVCHRPGILRIWMRCHPTDRAVAPYLHEIMILAKAWHDIMPELEVDLPLVNYCAWIERSFAPGHATLESL